VSRLKKASKAKIKNDLLEQLQKNGTCGSYYTDLIEDYMKMYDIKERCSKDIKERGVMVEYISNTGIMNKKKNEAVEQILKTNAQMLKILQSLGIKAVAGKSSGDDDGEL